MKTKKPIPALPLIAALISSLFNTPVSAWIQTTTTDGSNIPLSQKSNCLYYSINENGSDDVSFDKLQAAVQASFDQWEDVPCSYFHFIETSPTSLDMAEFNMDRANTNLLIWREKARDWVHGSSVVAMTVLNYDNNTGNILDADIEYNGVLHKFATDQFYPPGSLLTDIANTTTHEIGHILGFAHNADTNSTMYFDSGGGEIEKRTLTNDDAEGLCVLYPNENDPGTCKEPYCGLGVTGTEPCDAYTLGQDTSDCGCVATGTRRLVFFSLFSVLFELMQTM